MITTIVIYISRLDNKNEYKLKFNFMSAGREKYQLKLRFTKINY